MFYFIYLLDNYDMPANALSKDYGPERYGMIWDIGSVAIPWYGMG